MTSRVKAEVSLGKTRTGSLGSRALDPTRVHGLSDQDLGFALA